MPGGAVVTRAVQTLFIVTDPSSPPFPRGTSKPPELGSRLRPFCVMFGLVSFLFVPFRDRVILTPRTYLGVTEWLTSREVLYARTCVSTVRIIE